MMHKKWIKTMLVISMIVAGWILSAIAWLVKLGDFEPIGGPAILLLGLFLFFYGIMRLLEKRNKIEKTYHANGNLKSEISYTNNQRTVIAKYYYDNGVLKSEVPYTNMKIDGIKKEYYPDGKLQRETTYNNDVKGMTKNYYENGNEVK